MCKKICKTGEGWMAPPGKIYLVSLPITLEIPALKETELYAHKALSGKTWVVTEKYTGYSVGAGLTKKQAIDTAQRRILKAGNDKLKELIVLHTGDRK